MSRVEYLAITAVVLLVAWLIFYSVRGTPEKAVQESRVMVIDECEYLVFQNSAVPMNNYNFAITHKGNCANPIHRSNGGNSD